MARSISYVLVFLTSTLINILGLYEFFIYAGFPDGHLTEYERWRGYIYKILACPLLLVSIISFYFLFFSKEIFFIKKVLYLLLSIMVILAVFFIANHIAYGLLNHGQGG